MSSEGSSKQKRAEGLLQRTPPATPLHEINELLIPYMAALLQSSDSVYWLPATTWLCGVLSATQDPPIAKVLRSRVVPALLLSLVEENDPELQVEAAKALKCIASGTSEVTNLTVNQAGISLDALRHLLHSKDDEVLRHACCSLAVLSGYKNVKIRELLRESDLRDRLLELSRHPIMSVAALRTLGNIVRGDKNLIDWLMNRDDILVHLRSCLNHERGEVRIEACWIILHITSRNGVWVQAVIDAGLIEPLVSLVKNDKFDVMEVAIRAISNATSGATPEQIRFLVTSGCIEPFCYLFCCKNQEIFKVCLEGLENILEAGEAEKINKSDINPYAERIERIHGWGVLQDSVHNYEKKLYKKGCHLLWRYGWNDGGFESDDDCEPKWCSDEDNVLNSSRPGRLYGGRWMNKLSLIGSVGR